MRRQAYLRMSRTLPTRLRSTKWADRRCRTYHISCLSSVAPIEWIKSITTVYGPKLSYHWPHRVVLTLQHAHKRLVEVAALASGARTSPDAALYHSSSTVDINMKKADWLLHSRNGFECQVMVADSLRVIATACQHNVARRPRKQKSDTCAYS